MEKIINKFSVSILLASVLMGLFISSCKRGELVYTTTDVKNIYSHVSETEDFSMFRQIIDKAGYASFLNTYGTYTMFVTNNAGVSAYLTSKGLSGVDQIDEILAKKIIAISLISGDTITTNLFTDGKVRSPTTAGQYLITGVTPGTSGSLITINKQANLVKGNVRVGNGIIHIVDNLLVPAELTIAQTIAANPEYSIFRAALYATGFYDSLNVVPADNQNASRKYLTLIAQNNSVFQQIGITDSISLINRYSTKNDPKNHADSLWLFVANRIWPELSYVSDIAGSTLHTTLAPDQQTTSKLIGRQLRLNYDLIDGVQEEGQEILRPSSDVSATNGVIHSVDKSYTIIIRFPRPVYFDLADQPEIKRTPGLYKFPNRSFTFQRGTLSLVGLEGCNCTSNFLEYKTDLQNPVNFYFNNDWVHFGTRFRTGGNALNTSAVNFTTPVIIAGVYKVWIDYKRENQNFPILAFFDGELLPNTFNVNDGFLTGETEAQALIRGFKSYSESPAADGNGHIGRLLGTVNVTKTGRHIFRIQSTACTGCAAQLNMLDAVEFRPIDMPSQIYPKLTRTGIMP